MKDLDELVTPKDLQVAFQKLEGATEFFVNINDSSKRCILRWINPTRREKTRESRI